MNNKRPCPGFTGLATPHKTLIESRTVQIATKNGSTDPKNSGTRTDTAIVTQSWTVLTVPAGNFNCRRRIIAMRSRGSVWVHHLVFSAMFTLVTVFATLLVVLAVWLIRFSSLK